MACVDTTTLTWGGRDRGSSSGMRSVCQRTVNLPNAVLDSAAACADEVLRRPIFYLTTNRQARASGEPSCVREAGGHGSIRS